MYKPPPYILLIDDDLDDLEMLSSALEAESIKVKFFDSPVKALYYLNLMMDNKDTPLFIIMDYNMPKKTGREVLSLLKTNKNTSGIPVIIYSTRMDAALKLQLSDAGAFDCLTKPWTNKEFVLQIEMFKGFFMKFQEPSFTQEGIAD